jgi:AP endonuclease-2
LGQFLRDPDDSSDLDLKMPDPDTSLTAEPGGRFVDCFRLFHPAAENAFTAWSTITGSRATNYGVRIDYIFGDVDLVRGAFTGCDIMPDIMGSDHCPVQATLDWEIIPSKKCPPLCTKFMPEFSGKQQKLLSFFTKKDPVVKKTDTDESGALNKLKMMDTSEITDSQESRKSCMSSESSGSTAMQSFGMVYSSTHEHRKSPRKRSVRESSNSRPAAKRSKKEEKKSNHGKQGNLLSFFDKRPCKEAFSDTETAVREKPNEAKTGSDTSDVLQRAVVQIDSVKLVNENKLRSVAPLQKSASTSWKSLLKGPPPPPLCKGHQEQCLLRTVKKDSLNKGRQFWVCPRPDGHKSNPEARCNHFVWLDEKKKS